MGGDKVLEEHAAPTELEWDLGEPITIDWRSYGAGIMLWRRVVGSG
jgi:hypothetical protein